jgi:hypothetical protein
VAYRGESMNKLSWFYDQSNIDWFQLSELYRVAPLGNKSVDKLSWCLLIADSNALYMMI